MTKIISILAVLIPFQVSASVTPGEIGPDTPGLVIEKVCGIVKDVYLSRKGKRLAEVYGINKEGLSVIYPFQISAESEPLALAAMNSNEKLLLCVKTNPRGFSFKVIKFQDLYATPDFD